jgi:branched-chain amino acid transport system permease protein
MAEFQAASHVDKSLEVLAHWNGRMREKLRHLVTDELVAEHARNPLGQHSDALERVLNYLRRAPQPGKYAILCTNPYREYRIVVLAGARGQGARFLDERRFSTEKDALHAVFLERLKELRRG